MLKNGLVEKKRFFLYIVDGVNMCYGTLLILLGAQNRPILCEGIYLGTRKDAHGLSFCLQCSGPSQIRFEFAHY